MQASTYPNLRLVFYWRLIRLVISNEMTESDYYNTTYVLYENNTEETTNKEVNNDTKNNHTTEELP